MPTDTAAAHMPLPRPSIKHQVIAITLLGAALRLVGLHQSIWHDEASSILLIKMPFGQMLAALHRLEASPPVYYVVLWAWDHLFGVSVAASRMLGVVIGIPLAPVMYVTATRLTKSHRIGVIAAAWAACSPLMIWYAQEVRPYGLLALLTAVTFMAFVRLIEDEPTWPTLAIWAVASALALGTHFYAIFTVVPQAVWLLLRYRLRVDVLAGVVLIAICGLALIPLLNSETADFSFGYITEVPRSTRFAQILPQFLLGVSSPAHSLLKFACFGIAIAAIAALLLRGTASEQRAGSRMALFAVSGLALAMVVVYFRDSLLTRNLIGLWVPATIVLAVGLGASRNTAVGSGLALFLNAVGIVIVFAVASNVNLQRADWVGVNRIIASSAHALGSNPGRRLVVLENWLVPSPLQLYMPGLRPYTLPATGTAMTDVAEVDIVRAMQTAPSGTAPCWWGTPCLNFSSPTPHPGRIPGFHVIERRRIQEFVVIRLTAVGHPRSVSDRAVLRAISGIKLSANSYLSAPTLSG